MGVTGWDRRTISAGAAQAGGAEVAPAGNARRRALLWLSLSARAAAPSFGRRRYELFARRDLGRLSAVVFAWYQFSREGNTAGLRRAYVRWPLSARLKRRQPSGAGF